jgi:predicted XRE-type DNA-binding protein
MKGNRLEVVRGSGNVYRDFRHEKADIEQFKAVLAAEIIKALDRQGLNVRAAHDSTGVAVADFSHIRDADLGRFTIDRLISIINSLGFRVEMRIRLHPAGPAADVKNLDRTRYQRAREINDYDAANTATRVGSKALKFADLGLKLPEV